MDNAKKLDCDSFVRPTDIVEGNPKLNLAFMCHLFNSHPSLEFDASEMIEIEETREEKTLRNWINSLGVKPRVHHLFSDLADGIALAQLFDQVCKSENWEVRRYKRNRYQGHTDRGIYTLSKSDNSQHKLRESSLKMVLCNIAFTRAT